MSRVGAKKDCVSCAEVQTPAPKKASHKATSSEHPSASPCPEDSVEQPAAETKTTPYAGRLAGTFGVEISEESSVDVKDLRITGQPEINFGDPRVVSALAGEESCHTERENHVLVELPFELKNNGTISVDMEAFTKLMVKAKGVNLSDNTFSAGPTPQNPPQNGTPTPPPL
jgi:hypothetical protein